MLKVVLLPFFETVKKILCIGNYEHCCKKEENSDTVAVRIQGEGDRGSMQLKEFAEMIVRETENQLKKAD